MLSLLFLALLSAHQVLGELCANERFTVTREGQNRSSIISVPNGGLVTVLYNFTHPPGHYRFNLKTAMKKDIPREQYFSVVHTIQPCEDEELITQSCNQEDLVYYIRAGNCTNYTQGDFVTDLYLLMVTGNEMTNGTVINCSYSDGILRMCGEPSATIKVYDNDEVTMPQPSPNPSSLSSNGEFKITWATVLAGLGVLLQIIIILLFGARYVIEKRRSIKERNKVARQDIPLVTTTFRSELNAAKTGLITTFGNELNAAKTDLITTFGNELNAAKTDLTATFGNELNAANTDLTATFRSEVNAAKTDLTATFRSELNAAKEEILEQRRNAWQN